MGAIIFAREENRNVGCGEGFDGFQQDARETHSKYRLWSKRVGFAPLETAILPKMRGWNPTRKPEKLENEWFCTHSKRKPLRKWVEPSPLEYNIFPKTSGRTPFAELHILGENYPQVSAFLYFVGIFIHSIYGFYKKRVGITPLEMPILVKTSGTSSD